MLQVISPTFSPTPDQADRALHLLVDGETFACGDRRIVIASLSLHPLDHAPVWSALEAQRKTFACVDR
jgi:hypothetical protein